MPPSKVSTKKTYKKKTYRKKTYKKKPYNKPSGSLNKVFNGYLSKDPFPIQKQVKLNYVQNVVLSSGASGVTGAQQRFCLNGLYDPDTSGAGHQPYGYDQMATLYKRYKVNGCLVKLTFNDPNEDGVICAVQLVNPSNPTAFINGLDPSLLEERQQTFVSRINNTGSQKVVKKFYVPIYQASGLKKLQFMADPDNFTADLASNPGSVVSMLMAVGSEQGTGTATLRVTIDLTYYVTFYQRVQLAQSTI